MLIKDVRLLFGSFLAAFALFVCAAGETAHGIQATKDGGSLSGPLFSVAPDECWMYSTWSNQAKPDSNSANHTDQLLAEPEVNAFANDIVDRIGRVMPMVFAQAPEAQQQQIAEVAPAITDSLFKKSGCLFVEKVTIHDPETPPELEGALLLEIGDDAAKVAHALAQLAGSERGAKTVQLGGKSFAEFPVDPESGASVFIGSVDDYLLIGMGSSCIERAIARMSANKTPAWLNELDSRHKLARRNTLGYVNIAAVRKALLPLGGPPAAQIVNAVGLGNVQSLESSSGYSETEMVNRVSLLVDGKPQGALALFGDEGIQAGELNHVPADSLFAVALSVDPEKVFNFAQSLMLQFSPRDAEEMMQGMARFQEETGIDLRNDVINQIGPTWCLSNGASDGWFTGMALTVSVDEPDRLAGAIKKIIQVVMAEFDGDPYGPQFTRRTIGDSEVYSVAIPEMPLPFEPSWCISGNRLVVGMFPQTISTIVKPMDYEKLVDSTKFEGLRKSFSSGEANAKLLGMGYSDSRRQFEIMYPYVQMIMGMSRMFMTEMADMPPDAAEMMDSLFGGMDLPPARSIHKHLVPTVSMFRQTASGFETETRQTIPMVDVTFTVPVAIGLLLPAVQQVRAAARRTQSMNNLKQMALAMHNHESAFKRFAPGAGPIREGQPPVSWRVRILPYIEQNNLYDQYNFDEPWDSEHNLQFLEMMPEVYRSPTSMAEPGMTVYLGIGGPDGVMGPDRSGASRGKRFADILDGTSNTIMFMETTDELAVPWTKPDEGIDPDQFDMDSLFGMYPGGTNAAFCDGSVHFISETIDTGILSLLMKASDGQSVGNWEYEQNERSDFRDAPVPRATEERIPKESDRTLTLENFGSPAMAERASAKKDAERVRDAVIAMHNWHDAYRALPSAFSTDADGKPLLSWRVHLLPYMDEMALYDQFRQDEPWDSEHNIGLLRQMPACFQTAGSDLANGMTTMIAIGGEHGVISKPDEDRQWSRGIGLARILDGTSNTIMMVDAGPDLAVEWTRPDEFVPDTESIAKLLKLKNGFNAGFADGHVEKIPASTSAETVQQLFHRDDSLPGTDWRDKSIR